MERQEGEGGSSRGEVQVPDANPMNALPAGRTTQRSTPRSSASTVALLESSSASVSESGSTSSSRGPSCTYCSPPAPTPASATSLPCSGACCCSGCSSLLARTGCSCRRHACWQPRRAAWLPAKQKGAAAVARVRRHPAAGLAAAPVVAACATTEAMEQCRVLQGGLVAQVQNWVWGGVRMGRSHAAPLLPTNPGNL